MVASTFPEVYWAYEMREREVRKVDREEIPGQVVEGLSSRLWTFASNHHFPEPEKALRKRNYYPKSFKNYYKKYLAYIEESLKSERIKMATREHPYCLFDKFYTYDNKVYHFKTYNNQVIELPKADPLTLRNVAGIIADKNYVFNIALAPDSPPKTMDGRNNPNARWEWDIISGVDGGSFQYVKQSWDTLYWRDKHAVYIKEAHQDLKKVEGADPGSFEYLGFSFGRDRDHVFFKDRMIEMDPIQFMLNKNGFLYDQENIFHYENQLSLDAKTFKVLECKKGTNRGVGVDGHPFNGTFVLEDKNGQYEYNMDWEEKLIKVTP